MDAFSKLLCLGDWQCRHRLKLLVIYKFSDLEAATGNFAEENLLGRGSYGAVYKATLKKGQLAAVKRPTSATALSSTNNELHILSKIECPQVVNLLGFCHYEDEVILVAEYMANGSLHDVLHSKLSAKRLGWSRRLRIAIQAAKALQALHNSRPQIIHRDVKSSNILLDGNFDARLGDFGLALRGNTKDIMCSPAGTLGYADPRYDKPENVGPKIDVFSFGVLLLELLSGRQVIDESRRQVRMVDWALPLIKQGRALEICDPRMSTSEKPAPALALKRMAVVAARCVRRESKRPSMTEIVQALCQIKLENFQRKRSRMIGRSVLPCRAAPAVASAGLSSWSRSRISSSRLQEKSLDEEEESANKLELPPSIGQPVAAVRSSHL